MRHLQDVAEPNASQFQHQRAERESRSSPQPLPRPPLPPPSSNFTLLFLFPLLCFCQSGERSDRANGVDKDDDDRKIIISPHKWCARGGKEREGGRRWREKERGQGIGGVGGGGVFLRLSSHKTKNTNELTSHPSLPLINCTDLSFKGTFSS